MGMLALLLVLGLACGQASLRSTLFHAGVATLTGTAEGSIGLTGYEVAIDALEVEGLTKNASGLTYRPESGTLFTVINSPCEIVELSTAGSLVRRISVKGVRDIEGITHVVGDTFYIVDESDQRVFRVRVTEGLETIDLGDSPSFGLSLDYVKNKGFEGISWDSTHARLFLTQERDPLRVLMVLGIEEAFDLSAFRLTISEWSTREAGALFMRDLSSLSFHEKSGNLFLLSDESALVAEYSSEGDFLSVMPMWRGWHGLSARVPRAEGMAIGPDGAIYVLSEPNLFYKFVPGRPEAPIVASRGSLSRPVSDDPTPVARTASEAH